VAAAIGGRPLTDARPGPEQRRYIRHQSDIPIEVAPADGAPGAVGPARDVSLGGICFVASEAFQVDQRVHIRIRHLRMPVELSARVRWCEPAEAGYLVGAEFLEEADVRRARMVEQICYIEKYRKEVMEKESRPLTSSEAALEWIGKFASEFPASEKHD